MEVLKFLKLIDEDQNLNVATLAIYLLLGKALLSTSAFVLPAVLFIVLTNYVINRVIDQRSTTDIEEALKEHQALCTKLDDVESRVTALMLQQGLKKPTS